MPILRYMVHPEVVVDPDLDMETWRLSEFGRDQAASFASDAVLDDTVRIISSTERMAKETAGIIATSRDLEVEIYMGLHEIDRSSTGYLDPDMYDRAVAQVYAQPDERIRGWENARKAQERVASHAMAAAFSKAPEGDVLIIGHTHVGAFFYCALADLPLSIEYMPEQGMVFAVDLVTDQIVHGWQPVVR